MSDMDDHQKVDALLAQMNNSGLRALLPPDYKFAIIDLADGGSALTGVKIPDSLAHSAAMGDASEAKASKPSFKSDGLEKLLNIIDRMRSQGVSSFVDIPQIIVVGDHSKHAVNITIIPDIARSKSEKDELASFKPPTTDLRKFPQVINAAAKSMGIDRDQKTFSNDILRIELLPGLFHSATAKSSEKDRQAVEALVKNYMQSSRSIVLAVVSAKNDLNNQIVCQLARSIDPDGRRTLGIITKPDTLHVGSEGEKDFYALAENKDVKFALGWHVIKDRDYDTKDASNEERDRSETEFFSKGIWDSLPKSQTGVHALKSRLSKVLTSHILLSLPGLITDVETSTTTCKHRLEVLGVSRGSLQEQRSYLNDVAEGFASILTSAVRGFYDGPFFGDASTEEGFKRRLRAYVQEHLRMYSNNMELFGHQYEIHDNKTDKDAAEKRRNAEKDTDPPLPVTRDEYLEKVGDLITRTRGCELMGSYRPDVVPDLFKEQCRPWESMTQETSMGIFRAVKKTVFSVLDQCADSVTRDALLRHVINPGMEKIKTNMEEKVQELLVQYRDTHAMTFNHYFTDNVQKLRNDQKRHNTTKKLLEFFGRSTATDPATVTLGGTAHAGYNLKSLINALMDKSETNMEKFACMEAYQTMRAYYKVARKQMVDDFAKYAIEACLIKPLKDIFTSKAIYKMTNDTISSIAAESEESKMERESSTKKLKILNAALEALQDFGRSQSGA